MSHRAVVFIAFAFLSLTGCGALGGSDRSDYVAANEAIVDELPVFPGATEVTRESMEYTFEDGGLFDSPEGYGTLVTYRAPAGTSADAVQSFYFAAVDRSWSRTIEEAPVASAGTAEPHPPLLLTRLCRDAAEVGIDAWGVEMSGTFSVYVDHRYARSGVRQTACDEPRS